MIVVPLSPFFGPICLLSVITSQSILALPSGGRAVGEGEVLAG